MTTSIFTGLIIKSAWTPGLNGGSFPKLIPKQCVFGSLCARALGLILTLHIWLLPVQPHGLQWDCSWAEFDEYHIVLCITHRLSIKTVIHQQRGLQAYVSYVRGSWLWGPPFPSSPIASNSCPICFLYPQSHCFKFLPTLGSALPSSPLILCGLWEAIWGCIFKRQCFLRNTQYMQNSKLANFFPFFPLFCFFFSFSVCSLKDRRKRKWREVSVFWPKLNLEKTPMHYMGLFHFIFIFHNISFTWKLLLF